MTVDRFLFVANVLTIGSAAYCRTNSENAQCQTLWGNFDVRVILMGQFQWVILTGQFLWIILMGQFLYVIPMGQFPWVIHSVESISRGHSDGPISMGHQQVHFNGSISIALRQPLLTTIEIKTCDAHDGCTQCKINIPAVSTPTPHLACWFCAMFILHNHHVHVQCFCSLR